MLRTLLVVIACAWLSFGTASWFCMTSERRQRAIEKGYVSSAPRGFVHLLVRSDLASRVRAQYEALQVHENMNSRSSDAPRHYLATAISSVEGSLTKDEAKRARAINRKATRARHDWDSDAASSLASGVSGTDALQESCSITGTVDKQVISLADLIVGPSDFGSHLFRLHSTAFNFLYGDCLEGVASRQLSMEAPVSVGQFGQRGTQMEGNSLADDDEQQDRFSDFCNDGIADEEVSDDLHDKFEDQTEKDLHGNDSNVLHDVEQQDKFSTLGVFCNGGIADGEVKEDIEKDLHGRERWVDCMGSDGSDYASDEEDELEIPKFVENQFCNNETEQDKLGTLGAFYNGGIAGKEVSGDLHDKFEDTAEKDLHGEDISVLHDDQQQDKFHSLGAFCNGGIADGEVNEDLHDKFENKIENDLHGKDSNVLHDDCTDLFGCFCSDATSHILAKREIAKETQNKELHEHDYDNLQSAAMAHVHKHLHLEARICAPWRRRKHSKAHGTASPMVTTGVFDLTALDFRDDCQQELTEPPGHFTFTAKPGFGIRDLLISNDDVNCYLHEKGGLQKVHEQLHGSEDDVHVDPLHEERLNLHDVHEMHGYETTAVGAVTSHPDDREMHGDDMVPCTMVPFYVPCEPVAFGINKLASAMHARLLIDRIYVTTFAYDLAKAHKSDREFVDRTRAHSTLMCGHVQRIGEKCKQRGKERDAAESVIENLKDLNGRLIRQVQELKTEKENSRMLQCEEPWESADSSHGDGEYFSSLINSLQVTGSANAFHEATGHDSTGHLSYDPGKFSKNQSENPEVRKSKKRAKASHTKHLAPIGPSNDQLNLEKHERAKASHTNQFAPIGPSSDQLNLENVALRSTAALSSAVSADMSDT